MDPNPNPETAIQAGPATPPPPIPEPPAAPVPPAILAPPRRRRWWLLGCLGAALLMCCVGPVGVGGWMAWRGADGFNAEARADRNRLFAEALGEGNVQLLTERADNAFSKRHDRRAVQDFLDRHHAFLERDRFHVVRKVSARLDGTTYVRLEVRVDDEPETFVFYCRQTQNGWWQLVGIEPELDGTISDRLRERLDDEEHRAPRRSRWRHFFD